MREITIFVPTNPEYWGEGWDDLSEEEREAEIQRFCRLVRRQAAAWDYDPTIEMVEETFSFPHRNKGDASQIKEQAWDAWCRGESV